VLFLRLAVGLAAAMICLAGIGWYAMYLFVPDPRNAPARLSADQTSAAPVTPYQRRQNKRSVALGGAAVVGGLLLTAQALASIRSGIPIQVLNEPPMNGWIGLVAALFVIMLGLWLAGSSLGAIRTRHAPPGR
jgi:sterol desaturase/sphingolipid hydroxylase (fatty acid hydroxylase superfamily)